MTWNDIWQSHPSVFVAQNWLEYSEDKKKQSRLPLHFNYFSSGDMTLRVGIIATETILKEEEFFLAGLLWGNRLSNGAKTLIYYVAPDFSQAFISGLSKIGGNISARAVYWREKLTPSLYLIPEDQQKNCVVHELGEKRPDIKRWGQSLNPVTQQQLIVVNDFFSQLAERRVRIAFKSQHIDFLWGNYEIAEVRLKGKKFELNSKAKWLKQKDQMLQFHKQGWVDASGALNNEFCATIYRILDYLELLEREGKIRQIDSLSLWLNKGDGVLKSLWGSPWICPWLPKERGVTILNELEEWHFFQGNGQLSIICPIFEKSLMKSSRSILLSSVLERSPLVTQARSDKGQSLIWDGRVNWLTTVGLEGELQRWNYWLKNVDEFPIWTLPENWQEQGINQLNCRSSSLKQKLMQNG